MSQRALEALKLWREFATTVTVGTGGQRKSWASYIQGNGYVDEEKLVQPTVFPAFAQMCLSWTLQLDLAPEESGSEGKPDFTPADSVTHPFVFETKNTKKGTELQGDEAQVRRYLEVGGQRIKSVLLTNLVGARVFSLDEKGRMYERYRVNLRGLLVGPLDTVAALPDAERLANLFSEFSRKELSSEEKLARVRSAPPWNRLVEVTSSDWVLGRLDRVVARLTASAIEQIRRGAIKDRTRTTGDERKWILDELRLLASRLGHDAANASVDDFIGARESSELGKALQQFAAHVAYYVATRLMLVRVWEDLDLLEPMLYDGGFNEQMTRFDGLLHDVVDYSFNKARRRYRSLFDQRNSYTWFVPESDTYADVIYELANTYLGAIESDVLGQVYERVLERIDRKLLGVYYTPRDIIGLIWDLIGFDAVAEQADVADRGLRVLDIATGSGGFLVEVARRLRNRVERQVLNGADVDMQEWIKSAADGLNGIELNRFSTYLAELNLLVQFGQVIAANPSLRLPPMGVLSGDTLALHDPVTIIDDWESAVLPNDLIAGDEDRRERARKIKAAAQADFLMDVACGNPPYIGERLAAKTMARTRRDYPYWEAYVGQHMDYLYWFLILGVSKVRAGGRFGFITTEYWLRAEGAKPLRRYLARRCTIDRIVLFRDFKLFPDAPGQHSMIITGTRIAEDDASLTEFPDLGSHKPKISIYLGGSVTSLSTRTVVLRAIRAGTSNPLVRSFTSNRSPNELDGNSWSDVVRTRDELAQRARLTTGQQISLEVIKGNETTANKLTSATENLLSIRDLSTAGGPGSSAGIQILTPQEVSELGTLTTDEQTVLRTVVNTKDIYPYAVVLPPNANSVIYLAKPADLDPELADEQIITGTPFPSGMPNIERHLTTFRSLLEAKNRSNNERRPWWTLHRPRIDSAPSAGQHDDPWANYCLASRWGEGGELTVGRAPAGTSPASGLHVLRADVQSGVSAGYLAALYNSTLYQEIATSLPPGQLRKADLQAIGVPMRPEFTQALTDSANTLASLVTDLITNHAVQFPQLADALRTDITLTEAVDHAWLPAPVPKAKSGNITNLRWIEHVTTHRSGATILGVVEVSETLLGQQVVAYVRGTDRPAATITLEAQSDLRAAETLAAAVRGLAAHAGTVRDLTALALPIDTVDLINVYTVARQSLGNTVAQYRKERSTIDAVVSEML